MISYIEGKILDVVFEPKQVYIVVLTAGGIGYTIFVPTNSAFSQGDIVKLFTSFQVRDDSQSLYGFLSKESKSMFEDILTVAGVGPKVSLSLVSTYSIDEFKSTLSSGKYELLTKVPGLGQKGAKKIMLELQGIYVHENSFFEEGVLKDLKGALKKLGFSGKDLEELLDKGRKIYEKDGDLPIGDLISLVLKDD